MQSQNVTNLLDPVNPQDGATRQFVLDNAGGTVYTAKLFTTAGVYDTGDLVTQETAIGSGVYNVWILTGADQDGRVTPITGANSPGGTANQWEEFEAGGGGHVIQDADGNDLTQRTNLQFTGDVSVTDDSANNRTVVNVTGGGGTFGNYQFRSVDAGLIPGAQVGDAITGASVTIDASADILHATTFPAGLVDRTSYYFRVTGAVTGLAAGDYLSLIHI